MLRCLAEAEAALPALAKNGVRGEGQLLLTPPTAATLSGKALLPALSPPAGEQGPSGGRYPPTHPRPCNEPFRLPGGLFGERIPQSEENKRKVDRIVVEGEEVGII